MRDSQYVAANITGDETMARSVYSLATFMPVAFPGSSAIAVYSDGRLFRAAQSDSLGLHGRLRRNQGARRIRYKFQARLNSLLAAGKRTKRVEIISATPETPDIARRGYVHDDRVTTGVMKFAVTNLSWNFLPTAHARARFCL